MKRNKLTEEIRNELCAEALSVDVQNAQAQQRSLKFFVKVSQYFPLAQTRKLERVVGRLSYGFEFEDMVNNLDRKKGEQFRFDRAKMLKEGT